MSIKPSKPAQLREKAAIEFNCPGCGRLFRVEPRLTGRKIRCSQCNRMSIIPSESEARKRSPRAATPSAPETPPAVPRDETPAGGRRVRPADSGAVFAGYANDGNDSDPSREGPSTGAFLRRAPEEDAAPEDIAGLQKRLRDAEKALEEMSARRSAEEGAYSRTITALSTQIDGLTAERDRALAEVAALGGQGDAAGSTGLLRKVAEAIDGYCNDQLTAMQELRRNIKELTG